MVTKCWSAAKIGDGGLWSLRSPPRVRCLRNLASTKPVLQRWSTNFRGCLHALCRSKGASASVQVQQPDLLQVAQQMFPLSWVKAYEHVV